VSDLSTPALSMARARDWAPILAARTAAPPVSSEAAVWEGWLSDRYIPTHNGVELRDQAERTVRTCRSSRRRWAGFDRPAGFGKTELVSQWALNIGQGELETKDYPSFRFIWIEADGSMKGAGLFASILRFVGIEPGSTEKEHSLRHQCQELLPLLGTRYLVIDDGHMFRPGRLMADTCRSILRLPLTLICVGAELEESAWLGRAPGPGAQASDQMRRRHDPVRLSPLALSEPDQARKFTDLVADFRRLFLTIPGSRAPALENKALVADLHARSGGHPGPLFECLKMASSRALFRDRALTAEDVTTFWPSHEGAA
jgi:hypothetical protein